MSRTSRIVGAVIAGIALAAMVSGTAGAHPLGNFSVNHVNQLELRADGVLNEAVVDLAEIPTVQADPSVDTDGDGIPSDAERAAYAHERCATLAAAQQLSVDGAAVELAVDEAAFSYQPGQAGLSTSRLECRLRAAVDLDGPHTVTFRDDFETDRIGWREVVAVADGVHLVESDVAATGLTDGLRNYPIDLLKSPPDITDATITVEPLSATGGPTDGENATDARNDLVASRVGPWSRVVNRVEGTFDDLIGRQDLTLPVGVLAVALAALLGASHALLPGHGKTIMAAYIAGREGSARDAVLVGATVTGTHTGGVLILGLALTAVAGLAGEVVIGWLGVASGLLVAVLGLGLLGGLLTGRRRSLLDHHHHGHGHGPLGHHHGPAAPLLGHHDHHHPHADDHHPHHDDGHHGHDHHHHHHNDHHHAVHADHHHHDHALALDLEGDHDRHELAEGVDADRHAPPLVAAHLVGVGTEPAPAGATAISRPVPTAPLDDHHPPARPSGEPVGRPYSRLGLVGLGVAGGLVPSPSALIILLSAIALGRTLFGVLLVLAYGIGMATTLTLAGILLVVMRDRFRDGRLAGLARAGGRWTTMAPYATAVLVIVVGIGITLRSLWTL